MATTIGTTIIINGDVTCDEPLRIDGRVTGNILLREAELTVGKAAKVDADVRSTRVLVLGTVNGNVAATDRIELGESANVTGSLSADRVVLIEGARFNGRIDMDRRTIAAKVAHYKAEHPAQP
jgi:cytoskeletal protein CcmA (bactofilin family)